MCNPTPTPPHCLPVCNTATSLFSYMHNKHSGGAATSPAESPGHLQPSLSVCLYFSVCLYVVLSSVPSCPAPTLGLSLEPGKAMALNNLPTELHLQPQISNKVRLCFLLTRPEILFCSQVNRNREVGLLGARNTDVGAERILELEFLTAEAY